MNHKKQCLCYKISCFPLFFCGCKRTKVIPEKKTLQYKDLSDEKKLEIYEDWYRRNIAPRYF